MAIRNSLIEAYGLNSAGVNLLDHAGNHDYQSFGKANDNENTQIVYDNINNYVSVTQPEDANLGIYRILNSIIIGEIYNLSFYAYSDTDCDFLFGIDSASEVFGSSLHVNAGEWTKCWCVGKASKTTIAFYANSPSFKIRNVKFTKCSSVDCYFFQYTDINDELKPFVYNFKDLQTNCRNTEYFTDDNPINELISWENFKYLLKEFVEYEEWQYSKDKSYRTRNTISIIDWCDGSNKSSVSNTEREDATIEYGTPELTLVVDDIPASGGTISDGTVNYGQSKYYVYSDTRFKVTDESGIITEGLTWGDSVTAQSLGTTIKDRSIVGSLSVSTTINGKTESTTADVYQQANRIESYGTPTGRTLSVSDIPASGGTISRGTLGGTITQSCTYTSGSNGTLTNPTITSSSYSTSITADSLGTTIKDRTKIGTLTYTYICNKKTGSISADVYQQANNATDITYGDWNVSLSANKYTTSSSPAPAGGGTAAITSSASRTRIQNYTSGATSKLSNETVSPSLSVTGSGFSLSGSNVIIANRATTEGSSRTGSVTATHGGVSKSITLYQAENKLTGVSANGVASTGTVLNVYSTGGKVTWSPVVEYSSGWSGTPPSGVTITYSVSGEGATQSNNITTWANRGSIIGSWRGANVTLSAKSSYTTNPIKGIVSTGQNMNTVTDVNFTDCQGGAAHQIFSAAGAAYCYVGELTLSSGLTTHGAIYKDYITYNFESDFGIWELDEEGYYGVVTAPSRGYTLGAEKSGTLTYKISGTINGVSINKTASIALIQEANIVTAVSIVNVSGGTPTSSFTAAGSSGYNYYGKATYSSGNAQLSGINAEQFSYTLSGTGFSKSDATNKSYTKVIVANRITTIGNSRTGSLVVSFTNPSFTGYTNTVSSPALTLTQAGNYVTSFKVFMSTFSYDNISAGSTSATPKLVSQTPNIEYTFSSGSTSNSTPSSTYGFYSSTVSYKLGSVINGFTAVNSSSGVLTATNRGATIGNARTSGVVTRTLVGTWTPTASYNAGGTKTWSGSSTATCTQNGNYVTSLEAVARSFSYPTIEAGATSATPSSWGGSTTFVFSSGSKTTTVPSSTYGTLSSSRSYKLGSVVNGFTAVNSTSGVLTATSRGTTIGPARTSGIVTYTVTMTWTPTSSYNAAGTKTDTDSKTATCTQAANGVENLYIRKCGDLDPQVSFTAAGGSTCYTSVITLSSGSRMEPSGNYAKYVKFAFDQNWGVWTPDAFIYYGSFAVSSRGTTAGASRTGKFSCTMVGTIDGVSVNKSASLTITQDANVQTAVYDNPTVSLKVSDIPAAGGTISSGTVTYSQKWRYSYTSGSVSEQTAKTTGGSVSYSTAVSASSLGTTIKGRTQVGTLTATVTMNGKSGKDSAAVYQALNKMVSITEVKSNTTYSPTTLSAAGGNSTPSYTGNCKLTFSSGSTTTYQSSGWSGMEISRSWSLSSTTGFSINTNSGVVTAASRGTTIGAARSTIANAKLTFSYTNPSTVGGDTVTGTDTDNITITQALNTVTSIDIRACGGATEQPTVSYPASGASYCFSFSCRFSSGLDQEASVVDGLETWSFNQSWGTWAPTSENRWCGTLTIPSRGTTIGAARSGTLTCTLKGTINGVSINTSDSVTITQALNKVVSCTVLKNELSYPTIAAVGGTSNPAGAATATYNYSSGATGNPQGSTAIITYTMVSASGFSINTTSGVVTATNNTSTSSRTSGTITRTVKYSYTNPSSVGGNTISATSTKAATCTQSAGVKTYANPVVSLSYSDIPASGGSVSPSYSYSQTWGWNGATSGGGTITSGGTLKWTGCTDNTTGRCSASTKGTVISTRSSVTGSATLTVTLNGKSGSKSTTVYQALNTITSFTYVKGDGSAPTTSFAASASSREYYPKFTFSSGSVDLQKAYSNEVDYSISGTGFSLGAKTNATYSYGQTVTAASRGTTIGAARSGTLTGTLNTTINGVAVNKSATLSLTQALNTITSLRIVGTGPSTAITSVSASANIPGYSAIATFSTGTEAELNNYASYVSYSFNQSWGTWTSSGYYGVLTIASRKTTIGAARSGVLTCTVKGTINGVAVDKSDTLTITQALNKITTLAIIPVANATDTTSYPTGNFAASGGTKTPTKTERVVGTFSSGLQGYTRTSGAWYGGTLTLSRSWSMATATGFSINTSNGVVTASNRGTTIGASRTCNPKCVISGSFTNPSSVGGGVVKASSITDSFTLTQAANEKSNEYSNLVGHIQSTSWNKNAYYTNFWATGDYTERYTSGATGESGTNKSIPWDSVTTNKDWCRWNDVQGTIVYDGNTGLQRKATITGRIGSWTYSVEVTQAAGIDIGKLTLSVPVSIGFAEYWNITVRSTANAVIYSGGIDVGLSTNNSLVMTEECAAAVALDPGTVSFSTTYSTGTDRRYSGSISGTEQDQLKQGKDVTVYLS